MVTVQRLEDLKAEHERLQGIVKAQNLSPEEVLEMNQTHENLVKTMETLKQKLAETHRDLMALEVSVTNRVSATEEALDLYTNLLSNLELFPPLQEPWDNIDLTLDLNPAASNPQQLLIGSDVRKIMKPTLSAIAESKRTERSSVETERIRVDNELDQLSLECENVEEDNAEIEKKVGALNEQADDLRDVCYSVLMEWDGITYL
jgi:kinetochore protein NDC80